MDQPDETNVQEVRVLGPDQVKLERDAFDRLTLTVGEESYEAVRPARSYPISAPDEHIVIFDAEGGQIGLIEDIRKLGRSSRKVLTKELELLYLTSQVLAIRSVKGLHNLTTWEFETDRGVRTTYVKDRADIRRVPPRRVIFTDVNEMRFEIPDTAELDVRSIALLGGEA